MRERSTRTTVFVSTEQTGTLLSWFVCVELGILPKEYPEPCSIKSVSQIDHGGKGNSYRVVKELDVTELKQKLVNEFKDFFDESGESRQAQNFSRRLTQRTGTGRFLSQKSAKR